MASEKVTHSLPLTLEHELLELSDQVQGLLFLSCGDCSQAQLKDYSEQLTCVLQYGKALGFRACFLWQDGGIAIKWEPLAVAL